VESTIKRKKAQLLTECDRLNRIAEERNLTSQERD
jgi:hypothetical protein